MLKLASSRGLSRLCGRFLDTSLSRPLIRRFIRQYHIQTSDYTTQQFACFNDFFSRQIRPELRPIPQQPEALICPCDGLLSAYRISAGTVLPIKQSTYTISELLGGDPVAAQYDNGLCLVFRLCVDHYHRYCYLDSGRKGGNVFLPGKLHTVRPIALAARPVFVQNCRAYTVMETDHLGPVVQVEVGAMLVGKIQNHHGACRFRRGEEKGMFRYGGSTIVVLLEPGRAELQDAIWQAARRGVETPVRMGQIIGTASLRGGPCRVSRTPSTTQCPTGNI